jgi:hypothetical protein
LGTISPAQGTLPIRNYRNKLKTLTVYSMSHICVQYLKFVNKAPATYQKQYQLAENGSFFSIAVRPRLGRLPAPK